MNDDSLFKPCLLAPPFPVSLPRGNALSISYVFHRCSMNVQVLCAPL